MEKKPKTYHPDYVERMLIIINAAFIWSKLQ